jgi:hypothetical protein
MCARAVPFYRSAPAPQAPFPCALGWCGPHHAAKAQCARAKRSVEDVEQVREPFLRFVVAVVSVIAMVALRLVGRRLAAPTVALALVVLPRPRAPSIAASRARRGRATHPRHLGQTSICTSLRRTSCMPSSQFGHTTAVSAAAPALGLDSRPPVAAAPAGLAKARPPHRQFNRVRAADPGTERRGHRRGQQRRSRSATTLATSPGRGRGRPGRPLPVVDGRHAGPGRVRVPYRMSSGVAKLGISKTTAGHTITRARTASIGISMITVSLSASVMRMPAIAQAIRRQSP